MRLNTLLIPALLVIVIAAPIVDAIACDDCKDIVSRPQQLTTGADHSDASVLSPGAHPPKQEKGTVRDLCPICANTAAAMNSACCGVPLMISHTNYLPKLLALSDPSYSISKPPQN